jgi:hypothetical protein
VAKVVAVWCEHTDCLCHVEGSRWSTDIPGKRRRPRWSTCRTTRPSNAGINRLPRLAYLAGPEEWSQIVRGHGLSEEEVR